MQTTTTTVQAAQLGEAVGNTPTGSIAIVSSKEQSGPTDERALQPKTLPEIPKTQKWILWLGVALIAYANGLDNFTMSIYLQQAASDFNGITQYTTLSVIQSMILAVGMPFFAKFADIFGRAANYTLSILFFTIGTVVMASSQSIQSLGAGIVFFSLGNTGITVSQQLVVADLVGTRWRTTVSNLLMVHFIINFGIASLITDALLPNQWRWGVGMFTIINPAVTAPVVAVLALQQWKAYKAGLLAPYPYSGMSVLSALGSFARDIDLLGLFFLSGGFLLILLPLTIAGTAPNGYATGYIIAMFVLGAAMLFAWPVIELKVATPMVNIHKVLMNLDVVIPAAIIFCDHFSYGMTLTPAYQWCRIMFGWSVSDATYFTYTQSLCLVVFAVLGGFVATVTRRYKWITFAGACIRLLGLGLMVQYRSAGSSTVQAVMPQVIQGLGGGLMTANIMVVAQASVPHGEVAIITGFFLLVLELGTAIGSAVVGALQKELLGELHEYLDPLVNSTVVETIYAQGSAATDAYPLGTPIRTAVIEAWNDNMHQILIGAISIAAVDVILCALLSDKKLTDKQNLVEDEPTSTPVPAAMRRAAEQRQASK